MDETKKGETPRCPVCASRHVARAVVLRSDYRCPDCSALFDSDERIVADPRPWVERTHANRTHENRTGASATDRDGIEVNEIEVADTRTDERTRSADTSSPSGSGGAT